MKFSNLYGLQPADRIIEPIFQTGLSQHHVIYLGGDDAGVEWIAENYKFKGVRLVKASDYFLLGKKVRVKKFTGNQAERETAVTRALHLVGAPYDLINFNCEHYAEYVQTRVSSSKQVNIVKEVLVATFAISVLAMAVKIFSNPKILK